MKILFVTPFLPTPPRFGAERRLDALARELARKHEVSLLWFNFDNALAPGSVAATRSYCRELFETPVLRRNEAAHKRAAQLKSLLTQHSFEHVRAVGRADFQAALDDVLRRERFDVVQFESASLAAFEFANSHAAPLFVLDEHNIEYELAQRMASASPGRARALYNALNWRKLRREERAAWRRFDGICLTSERDRQTLLADFGAGRTAVVPNGVDAEAFARAPSPGQPDLLLFFGALNYFPNQDGLLYFIDRVLPLIRQRRPGVRLQIVGPSAPASLRSRRDEGVDLVGLVDDLAPYLERAAAVVVPLRMGGGTRLKLLEALAASKAVVSTRMGAEGIPAIDGQHLLLADDPATFAGQVTRLLEDSAFAQRLGSEGRQLVSASFTWPRIVAGLERFYQELSTARDRYPAI